MNILWEVVEQWPNIGLLKDELVDSDTGARCAMGILDYIGAERPNYYYGIYHPAMHAWSAIAKEQYPERTGNGGDVTAIVDMNNHPDTTLLEMVTLAEKAAIRLDETV